MRRAVILCATGRAVEEAKRHGVPGVLEVRVEEAFIRGDIEGGTSRKGDTVSALLHGHGLAVICQCAESPGSGRKAWLPIAVRRDDRARAA